MDQKTKLFQHSLAQFLNAMVDMYEQRPNTVISGSRMAQDITNFGGESPFRDAITFSDFAFQYTHDHLSLFVNVLSDHLEPITSCTLIRSILETAAIGAWVTDPSIATVERVARVYSIRYESIVQNVKVLQCTPGIDREEVEKTKNRIDSIANHAAVDGIDVNRENGRIKWIGKKKPSATELITDVLNAEWIYRLLSAVAHGHHWALRDIGFERLAESNQNASADGLFVKRKFPEAILLFGMHGMLAYSRLIWNTIGYSQTDMLVYEEMLETAADQMNISKSHRFWRS
jgi:hypothetical protein